MSDIMTGDQIRSSFLQFFREREHTIVPSSSLLPDSPNLLFTNAGMNQFVPIFLGQRKPDVSRWPGAIPGRDTRAANTQKCIRAGGKHNDLEDVGLDTYHHTFFEMLGNWSFGDYFKKEAIEWAWELLTERWNFPKHRLYATVYRPAPGEPAELDEEALELWRRIFRDAGLDPQVHIHFGSKKDNFWMMGDTGPCGPCSEIHIDLTPEGNSYGRLVNAGSPLCIEIWNLVFIQFNANEDGTFSPLPTSHVDTGMGFERAAAVIQCTDGFKDFSRPISNYDTDIFRPLISTLSALCQKTYKGTVPSRREDGSPIFESDQQRIDVAFRVICDHIRAVAFAVADGILPGNTDRQYVVRRILRRAVRYGRILGFHEPFLFKLVDVLAQTMGHVFPEIAEKKEWVKEVIQSEEAAFNRTLDRGIELFYQEVERLRSRPDTERVIPADVVFKLYDTYGFPVDLTELMARELGFEIDKAGFEDYMEQQRERARKAHKREVVHVSDTSGLPPTLFVGYDRFHCEAQVTGHVHISGRIAVTLDTSPFYAEGGGQVGDSGQLVSEGNCWRVIDTQKIGDTYLHILELEGQQEPPAVGSKVIAQIDKDRRMAMQRHHTATHLLHWALHQLLGPQTQQKGSYVGPDKLTFDFNARALTRNQIEQIERIINEKIIENHPVSWTEVKYEHIRHRSDIRQLFGEKYGEWVRVVQIGGTPHGLDGFWMELCGGTHCRATGELGLFRIISESAVAAGIRRIEACAGLAAYQRLRAELNLLEQLASRLNTPLPELDRKIVNLTAQLDELSKQLTRLKEQQAKLYADQLRSRGRSVGAFDVIIERLDSDPETLQSVVNILREKFEGPILIAGIYDSAVHLVTAIPQPLTSKLHAGIWAQRCAKVVGGGGGGKPDSGRGGGRIPDRLNALFEEATSYLLEASTK